jgi:hypothetical protein
LWHIPTFGVRARRWSRSKRTVSTTRVATRVVVTRVVRYYRYRDIYGHGLSFYFNNLRGSFMNNDLLRWWFFASLFLDWSWSR